LGIPKGFWDGKRIVNDEVNREVEEYIDKIRLNEGILMYGSLLMLWKDFEFKY